MRAFMIVVVMLFLPVSFAHAAYESFDAVKELDTLSVEGVVVSTKPADLDHGKRGEVYLTSTKGETWMYLLSPKLVIRNKEDKEILLNDLKPGDQIAADYAVYHKTGKKIRIFEIQSIKIK